jgi:uncharacterized OB-fold protein
MSEKVKLNTTPSKIDVKNGAWVLHFPRFGKEGTHFHTYGQLTPYFQGLTEGKLMGTKCVNPKCPISKGKGELWVPPRMDCPDCHAKMVWEQVKNPQGYIYTYTHVERGGTGLEIETPYYQVDVFVQGVCTIIKGYLINRTPIKIGDKVKAGFLTGDKATNTCLDIYWELL